MRRNWAPTSPAKTRPRLTPMRNGERESASAIARAARRIRSSSSPAVWGAPATRISLPPSLSMSVSRKLTPCSSATRWAVVTSSSRRREPIGAVLGEKVVHAAEVDEGDRGLAVLRLGVARLEVAPDRRRHAGTEVEAVERRQRLELAPDPRRCLQQPAAPLDSPKSRSGSVAAVSSLTRISPASAPASISTVRVTPGPVSSSSRCDLADEEEVEGVAVDADVHLERDRPDRGLRPPELSKRPAHAVGRVARRSRHGSHP